MTAVTDTVETLGASTIQHGPLSDRIYLISIGPEDRDIAPRLTDLAAQHDYGKIFAKVPESRETEFAACGFETEARVPGFFNGREDGLFMALFRKAERGVAPDQERIDAVLAAAHEKALEGISTDTDISGIRECTPDDIGAMIPVFSTVFESYPFPIHDPAFLLEQMNEHTRYFGVWRDERLMALSSAEMYPDMSAVEMTDFATLPEARGGGLAARLLAHMDRAMHDAGYRTGYTIARAVSFGMNIVFARAGYQFAGTLVNNTNIAGSLESMNVWYKPLAEE